MRWFKEEEFACRCGRGSECDAVPMSPYVMQKADELRGRLGVEMVIDSGTRCKVQNDAVGGEPGSFHLQGLAFDVACPDGTYMRRLVSLALLAGFAGIGVKRHMVHLDCRQGVAVMFGYETKKEV